MSATRDIWQMLPTWVVFANNHMPTRC